MIVLTPFVVTPPDSVVTENDYRAFQLGGTLQDLGKMRPRLISLQSDASSVTTQAGSVNGEVERLKELYQDVRVKELVTEVEVAHNVEDIRFALDPRLKGHGAFDPDSKPPVILVNPASGLNAANIAHSLIHALQIAEGYPTIQRGIFPDKRQDVVVALSNSVLDIPLVVALIERGFSPSEYLEPTLEKIEEVFSSRPEKNELSILRFHYEAAIYIRLEYEGAYLSREKRAYFDALFGAKSPIGYRLGEKMLKIIRRSSPYSARGNAIALVRLLEFLNTTTIGRDVSDFRQHLYTPCIDIVRRKYVY